MLTSISEMSCGESLTRIEKPVLLSSFVYRLRDCVGERTKDFSYDKARPSEESYEHGKEKFEESLVIELTLTTFLCGLKAQTFFYSFLSSKNSRLENSSVSLLTTHPCQFIASFLLFMDRDEM